MAPRGLKAFVTSNRVGKFCGGKRAGYRATRPDGGVEPVALRGITKLLDSKIYSSGTLAFGGEFRGGAWQGPDGGARRGRAVDAQVSRLAGVSAAKRAAAKSFKLTTVTFAALDAAGLEPLLGQRVVVDPTRRLATAVDVLCFEKGSGKLVAVELKSGYSGDRTLEASDGASRRCLLNRPFQKAKDCVLHRHFAQLTATLALLTRERAFFKTLKDRFQVDGVRAVLLYVTGTDSQMFDLPRWWQRRGPALLDELAQ